MRALDRKVGRDLWHLRGQVLAVAVVIASGVAVLVMASSTQRALLQTAEAYYDRYAFGEVFAGLKRAPEPVEGKIAAIPGVQTVQTRVVRFATLDVEGFAEPVMGQFVSIPEGRPPVLNRIVLRAGRSIALNQPDEVVLNEPFAAAHGFRVGDELVAVLNGHRRTLRVVGVALSPEFIYSLGPGALMPDDRRFGVMWMGREALAAAFDLRGAFNNVSLRLMRGVEPQAREVLHEFAHMPGVLAVESMRSVSAEFRVGAVRHRGTLTGVPQEAMLQPVFDDVRHAVVGVPAHGLVLATRLASKLGVEVGDHVWVNVLEGRRPQVRLPVVDLVETYIAMPAYVRIDALNRLMRERPVVQHVSLLLDPREAPALYRELKALPEVSAVTIRQAAVASFYDTVIEHVMVFITSFSIFACALGFGVTYNATRIALSERGRELATLRVMGFSRGEVSYILLGEVDWLVVLALPFGCLPGRRLVTIMAQAFDTELFRIPLVIEPSTYGTAVSIALAATFGSMALVRRRVDHLDLIKVLKTRE